MNARLRILFGLVVAATLGLLLWNSAAVPLLDPDEARFARTSVEMLRFQDPVLPHFEGQPRLVKPPLMHWVQSFFFRAVGQTEWVARLHAILATLASVLIVGWLARLRFGAEGAVWASAFLLSLPLVVALGHVGTIDALLAVHVLAVVALDLTSQDRDGPYVAVAMGALMGLAFLAKGPVGVILPLLILLAGRTAARREILPSFGRLAQGIAAWAAVTLPWGLAFIRRVGLADVRSTLDSEILDRFFAGTDHVEPWWFYVAALAVGFLPWMGPLLVALVRALVRRDATQTPAYVAAGLVAGLVFFSLGKSKLPSYVLPLAPLAAMLLAWQVGEDLKRPRERSLAQGLLIVSLPVFAAAFVVAGVSRPEAEIRVVAWIGAGLYAGGALVAAGALWKRRPRWVWGSALSTAIGFLFVLVALLLPQLSLTRTSAHLIRSVPQLSDGRPPVVVEMQLPSLTYYLDRVPEVVYFPALESRIDRGDEPLLIFDEDDLAQAPPAALSRLREVGRQGKYVVFEVDEGGGE